MGRDKPLAGYAPREAGTVAPCWCRTGKRWRVTVSPVQFYCTFIPPGRVSLSLPSRLLPLLLQPLPLPCGKEGAVH